MKNDRLRIPIDQPYLHVLGLATICFARLEWSAVWCAEKVQPAYINSVGTKTAGQIANDLVSIATKHPDKTRAASLGTAAAEFRRLVKRRNDLVHANPGTSVSGQQRLFRAGSEWSVTMIEDLADEFAAAGIELNNLYHNIL